MATVEFTPDADPRVSVHISDILTDLQLLHARLDSLAGAATAIGQALDQPGSTGEPRIAYAAAFIMEQLHQSVGEIVVDVEALRSWAEQQEGGAK
jgi:hypothetical protein